jgi:hypothetical protein
LSEKEYQKKETAAAVKWNIFTAYDTNSIRQY